jgi:hypothetical protein
MYHLGKMFVYLAFFLFVGSVLWVVLESYQNAIYFAIIMLFISC